MCACITWVHRAPLRRHRLRETGGRRRRRLRECARVRRRVLCARVRRSVLAHMQPYAHARQRLRVGSRHSHPNTAMSLIPSTHLLRLSTAASARTPFGPHRRRRMGRGRDNSPGRSCPSVGTRTRAVGALAIWTCNRDASVTIQRCNVNGYSSERFLQFLKSGVELFPGPRSSGWVAEVESTWKLYAKYTRNNSPIP